MSGNRNWNGELSGTVYMLEGRDNKDGGGGCARMASGDGSIRRKKPRDRGRAGGRYEVSFKAAFHVPVNCEMSMFLMKNKLRLSHTGAWKNVR